MAIMFNLIANGHDLRDRRNSEHVEWLSVAMRSLDESILKELPTLKLFLQVSHCSTWTLIITDVHVDC